MTDESSDAKGTAEPDPADGADPGSPADPGASRRYGRLTLADDSVVVYDRRRTDAWIQSDVSYTVAARADPSAPSVGDGGPAGGE